VNAVGDGKAFGMDYNTGWVLAADGHETALPLGTKTLMASRILDAVLALRTDEGAMRPDGGAPKVDATANTDPV
jgi:phosphopantothenoylcysteine decarboxylase/phosphopantothenate--cysteine ligase